MCFRQFEVELNEDVHYALEKLLNHTNLGIFSGVLTSPYFGQATSAQPPRRFEVGTRFNF
jgi:hypothetical protein